MKANPEIERWFIEKKPPTEATVQVSDKKRASLMFNRGGRIPGEFPHIEGSGPSARFMRFASPAEAKVQGAELAKTVVAWCSLTSAERGSTKKP